MAASTLCWACGSPLGCGSDAIVCPSRSCGAVQDPPRRSSAAREVRLMVDPLRWIPPLLVAGMIGSACFVAMVSGLPWYWRMAQTSIGIWWCFLVSGMAIVSVVAVVRSFVEAVVMDPGVCRPLAGSARSWQSLLGPHVHLSGVRRCPHCEVPRLPAVSHCSAAGVCVWRLDHQCVITGQPVAARSLPAFVRLLAWVATAGSLAVIVVAHGAWLSVAGTGAAAAAVHLPDHHSFQGLGLDAVLARACCRPGRWMCALTQAASLVGEASASGTADSIVRGSAMSGLQCAGLVWLVCLGSAGALAAIALAPPVLHALGSNRTQLDTWRLARGRSRGRRGVSDAASSSLDRRLLSGTLELEADSSSSVAADVALVARGLCIAAGDLPPRSFQGWPAVRVARAVGKLLTSALLPRASAVVRSSLDEWPKLASASAEQAVLWLAYGLASESHDA